MQAGLNVWTSHGPEGGNVRAPAIDPKTPTTLYAGIWAGGVFKSTDSGTNWKAASAGFPPDAHLGALAIDPEIPATLYAGTSRGVDKTTDGGQTWNRTGLTSHGVRALVVDPVTPATLYAGAEPACQPGCDGGLFASTDGGATWRKLNSGLTSPSVDALAIVPTTPATLYAGTPGAGVFKSTDAGGTWRRLSAGLTSTDVRALAIDPLTPRRLYAGTMGGGVFEIDDLCDNGVLDPGEACDDGNASPYDGCTNSCTRCGNGVLTAPEQCDDGNAAPFDGCTTACTRCGDGVVTPSEGCDDGNLADRDACGADCRLSVSAVGTGTPESCTETALDEALAAGRSVTFDCGGPRTITVTREKVITSDATVDGGGTMTLSGGQSTRVFRVARGAKLNLLNLTITAGSANFGGAIYNEGEALLTSCTLRGNVDDAGGAVDNEGTATLEDCTLSGNSAGVGQGGAIANLDEQSLPTLTDSTLSGNAALSGGAVYNGGTAALEHCRLNGNESNGHGGGGAILSAGWFREARTTLTDCTLTGNSAETGGAIFSESSTTTLTDCRLTGNHARNEGGAVASVEYGTSVLANCTLDGNVHSGSVSNGDGDSDPVGDGQPDIDADAESAPYKPTDGNPRSQRR